VQPDEPMSARDEVRVSEYGLLRCPSCGESAAEIVMTDHCLVLVTRTPVSRDRGFGHPVALMGEPECSCECRDGQPVVLTGAAFETWQAAANIALADDVNFAEKQHYRWLYYPRP